MIRESVYQEDITIVNICLPSVGTSKYVKEIIEPKGEIHSKTVITRDYNIPLSTVDTSSHWKSANCMNLLYPLTPETHVTSFTETPSQTDIPRNTFLPAI